MIKNVLLLSLALLYASNTFSQKKVNVGIIGGAIGLYDNKDLYDDITCAGLGLSTTIYNVYADFMFWPRSHEGDTSIDKWDDKSSLSIHGGYQIPIGKIFRVIPIVGYSEVKRGVTDGSHWSTSSSGIHNSFKETGKVSGFDYGAVVRFNIKDKFTFDVAGTRYALYGGIGLNF